MATDKGIGLGVLSAATFGTSGAFATALQGAGWSPAGAVTVRIGVAAILLSLPAVLALRGRWMQLWRARYLVLAYGVIAAAGCQLFYFNAMRHLSVSVALLLEYSGVLLVVAWLWAARGQRPRRLTVLGAATAVLGLCLVLDVAGKTRLDGAGVAWGAAAAAGLALYFVLSSRAEDGIAPVALAWAGLSVGALTMVAAGAAGAVELSAGTRNVRFLHHEVPWFVPVGGLALVATVVAYSAGIGAARVLGAKLASFISLTEVLFATLFAWILLDQAPTTWQLAGGAVVLAGIALVKLDERAPEQVTPEPASVP